MLHGNNTACTRAGRSSESKTSNHGGLPAVYNVRIRGGDVEDFQLERDYEELRRMMTRRERGEGAEDEQGEVGLNKV